MLFVRFQADKVKQCGPLLAKGVGHEGVAVGKRGVREQEQARRLRLRLRLRLSRPALLLLLLAHAGGDALGA